MSGGVGDMEHFNDWAQSGGMQRAADMEARDMAKSKVESAREMQAGVLASTVEQMVDKQLEEAEEMEQDYETIRKKRIEQMRKQQQARDEGRRNGHGSLKEVTDQKEFFQHVKESSLCVCHFYRSTTKHCSIVDMHLARLAPAHLETKFMRIDAEKSQYLVEKLMIVVMPTICLIRDGKVEDKIEGFDSLGYTEHFSTATLEKRIKTAKVIDHLAMEEADSDDDFDAEFDLSDDE